MWLAYSCIFQPRIFSRPVYYLRLCAGDGGGGRLSKLATNLCRRMLQ